MLKTISHHRELAMADVNRGNRPLSPHLQIYRPQISSVLSILHRMTGVGMALGAVLVVWWLLAAATGPEYFAIVDGLLTSWVGLLVLLGVTWALAYHLLNGIRHLFWDMGYGYELETVDKTGWAVVIGSAVLTVLLWLVA
jgi:succinate dehydrogenase / fumarate reductase cytochrome b subunit